MKKLLLFLFILVHCTLSTTVTGQDIYITVYEVNTTTPIKGVEVQVSTNEMQPTSVPINSSSYGEISIEQSLVKYKVNQKIDLTFLHPDYENQTIQHIITKDVTGNRVKVFLKRKITPEEKVITGRVYNKKSGNPIGEVQVYLYYQGKQASAFTKANGSFEFKEQMLPREKVSILFNHPDYQSVKIEKEIVEKVTLLGDNYLQSKVVITEDGEITPWFLMGIGAGTIGLGALAKIAVQNDEDEDIKRFGEGFGNGAIVVGSGLVVSGIVVYIIQKSKLKKERRNSSTSNFHFLQNGNSIGLSYSFK